MGPIIIFDKSALEALSPDESVWLGQLYISNITPLFFVETLADLEKKVRAGRTPEDVVGSLAYRTPDIGSQPNTYHTRLIVGELLGGAPVEIATGQVIVSHGRSVELGGSRGVVLDRPEEMEAFERWRRGGFLELERTAAKGWRQALSGVDLDEVYRTFRPLLAGAQKPTTLAEVKLLAEAILHKTTDAESFQKFLSLLDIAPDHVGGIADRWERAGRPPIQDFAPYSWHVALVDLTFRLSIAADLIGRGRPSHVIDVAYLYYLPFCMVFASGDRLHQSLAPLFLRDDQSFVTAAELKADLAALDAHFSDLPEEVKSEGTMSFAVYPPESTEFLTTRLWDRHLPAWREHHDRQEDEPLDPELERQLVERIRELTEGTAPSEAARAAATEITDCMVVEYRVPPKKGKWIRFKPADEAGNLEPEGAAPNRKMVILRTAEEFNRMMEEVDEELRRERVAIRARSLEGLGKVDQRLGVISIIGGSPEPAVLGKYHGASLNAHISQWFRDRYGVRLGVGPMGRAAFLLRGDPWTFRLPVIYGSARCFADPDVEREYDPGPKRGAVDVNVLLQIEEFTLSYARSLQHGEREALLAVFTLAMEAFHALHTKLTRRFVGEALGDLEAAVLHVTSTPPRCGLSKWSSLLVAEKLLKSYLFGKQVKFKRDHDLVALAEHCETHGLQRVDRGLVQRIQCQAGVRYDSALVSLPDAVDAHHASLEICRTVGGQL